MAGFMNEIASRCANFTSGTSWSFLQDVSIMSLITGDDMTSKDVRGYHLSTTLENNLGPYFSNPGSTVVLTAKRTYITSSYVNFPPFGTFFFYNGSRRLNDRGLYATLFVDYAVLDNYGGRGGSSGSSTSNLTNYAGHIPIIRSRGYSHAYFACMLCQIRVTWSNNSSSIYYRIIYDGAGSEYGGTIYCGLLFNFSYNIKSINVDGVLLFTYDGGTSGFGSYGSGLHWDGTYFTFNLASGKVPTTYQNSNQYWAEIGRISNPNIVFMVNQKNSNL